MADPTAPAVALAVGSATALSQLSAFTDNGFLWAAALGMGGGIFAIGSDKESVSLSNAAWIMIGATIFSLAFEQIVTHYVMTFSVFEGAPIAAIRGAVSFFLGMISRDAAPAMKNAVPALIDAIIGKWKS